MNDPKFIGYRFRTPPGWDPPPEGWTAPPGWLPPAHWPPAPTGWEFYEAMYESDSEPVPATQLPPPTLDPILAPVVVKPHAELRTKWA